MDASLTWQQIRPWKTPLTVSRRIDAVCGKLQAEGTDKGTLLYALLLAVYDLASSEDETFGADLVFERMKEFGEKGLASLPQSGASAAEPVWDGVTYQYQHGDVACAAIREEHASLKKAGVSYHEVSNGLLLSAGNLVEQCDEPSRRYWFRQFEELGSKGYATAKVILESYGEA